MASKGAAPVRKPGKNGSLTVVDLSDPRQPAIVGAVRGLANAEAVAVRGHLCLVGGSLGLHVIDVRDPARPSLAATLPLPPATSVNEIVLCGNVALCADKAGFVRLVDVADPVRPRLLGSVDTLRNGGLDTPHDLGVHGRMVYVLNHHKCPYAAHMAAYRAFDDDGVMMDADTWDVMWTFGDPDLTHSNRMEIQGEYLYVGFGSLHVFDLREPGAPKRVAVVDSAVERITGMAVHGSHLLVAGDDRVEVFDMAEPEALRPVELLKDGRRLAVRDTQGAHGLDAFRAGDGASYVAVASQGTGALVLLRLPP